MACEQNNYCYAIRAYKEKVQIYSGLLPGVCRNCLAYVWVQGVM